MKPRVVLLLLASFAPDLFAQNTRAKFPDAPLPPGVALPNAAGRDNGLRFADLNGDGYDDLLLSNTERYAIHLFNDVDRRDLGWSIGWPHVIRAGVAGDAHATPPFVDAAGKPQPVALREGALWVKDAKSITYDALCRPPAPPPLSPADSLAALRLRPDFTAQLVAAEPLVADPIYMDWGADGKLWVVEMADYPFHDYNGVTHQGRVKFLEDADGDGIYDKATTFLDALTYPTGLAPWKNGVIVASVPEVFFAEDTDGDGRADRRTPILRGFHKGNPQHLVNGFAWGLDGWYYGANGDSGGTVTEAARDRKQDIGGRDFRVDPRTGAFDLEPGNAQFGRWRDDFGNWFGINNASAGWHYFLDDRHLARNPKLAVRSLRRNLNGTTRIFPASDTTRRFNQPQGANALTSACSIMPYRDDFFGPAFANSLFICDPQNNLVHREVLEPDGISFRSRRAPDEVASEFLASTDLWSRFTMARTGPDGALYVADFYRHVLEHPEWIPKQLLAHLDLYAGNNRGRIYRIAPTGAPRRSVPRLDTMTDAELAAQLDSPNGWTRDTAQRLLIERGSKWSTTEITGTPAARIHKLWTMHTLGTLTPPHISDVLRHFDWPPAARIAGADMNTRLHAIRLAENFSDDADVLNSLVARVSDPDERVRIQLAFTLGEFSGPKAIAALRALAARDGANPNMIVALLSSAPKFPELTADAERWLAAHKGKRGGPNLLATSLTFTNVNPDRAKVINDYAVVSIAAGNAERGHGFYLAYCSMCHRLKGEGHEAGPDLSTVAAKPTEQLLEAILDPNRAVEQRYLPQIIRLKSGRVVTGLPAEETANSITLKLGGANEVILKTDIAKQTTATHSLMPDGFETVLGSFAMADLIAWLRATD